MQEEKKAFDELKIATNKATISASEFRIQYEKVFPKRTLKEAKFKKKAKELEIELIENLLESGIGCDRYCENRNACEGVHCEMAIENYFGEISRNELSRKYFELYGERFYSFSRRLKNELLK